MKKIPQSALMLFLIFTFEIEYVHSQELKLLNNETEIFLSDSVIHDQPDIFQASIASNIVQCFDNADLTKVLENGQIGVIVHHGEPLPHADYNILYSHTEYLPFYVNKDSGVETLSASQAKSLLTGNVKSWKELGGSDTEIEYFGPTDELKIHALENLTESNGVDISDLEFSGIGNYEFLAQTVVNNSSALSLGLRSRWAKAAKESGAVQILPKNSDGSPAFRTPIYVYVKKDDGVAMEAVEALLVNVQERAAQDGNAYPLSERLNSLGIK